MITYNNWLESNVCEIARGEKFILKTNMFLFKKMLFFDACDFVAKDISEKYDNLYVALSGGMDSEYVVRCFHRNKLSFTPIIVKCKGSEIETNYAERICEELNLTPKILYASDKDILEIYDNICQTGIIGDLSILRTIASKYVHDNGGTIITGHTILGDTGTNHNEYVNEGLFDLKDHDSLLDAMNMPNNIAFFLYHPSIVYSIVEMSKSNLSWNQYKMKMYELPFREKRVIEYSAGITSILHRLKIRYNLKEIQSYSLGNKDKCLQLFEPFILQ